MVVDLRLAFTEYKKEFPEEDAVIPAFKPFSNNFWPEWDRDLNDSSGWSGSECLHGQYCCATDCVIDLYSSSQKAQFGKLEPRIQEVLEEFEVLPQKQDDLDRFKDYLEEQDLIELLPGVVPGFALRNRAWGKCKHEACRVS